MPYLDKEAKNHMDRGLIGRVSGELNYKLTLVILDYLAIHGRSYQICNDIVGALDNCKDEFRRRVQHPYEDEKIKINGDVYPEEVLHG